MATTKFVSVRIRQDQYEVFQQVAELNYSSVNKLIQQAADNFITDEAPVWINAAKQVRKQLKR